MFLAHHLMSENIEKREGCDDDCELRRLPLFPVRLNKAKKEKKVGEVVKGFIKDAKEELKNEKKKMKEEEHEI
jgi:hypothetical protein